MKQNFSHLRESLRKSLQNQRKQKNLLSLLGLKQVGEFFEDYDDDKVFKKW